MILVLHCGTSGAISSSSHPGTPTLLLSKKTGMCL